MDNDTKNLLMQYLGRLAEHYQVESYTSYTFKRRNELLEKLGEKDKDAFTVAESLFNAFIKQDRIANDKEKFDKARVLWEAEHAAAEKEKVQAEMQLIKYCKQVGIPVGGVNPVAQ
jgi:hypothetical protein